MTLAVHIRGLGEFCQRVDDVAEGAALPDLKEHVHAAIGQPVRRISRFMQLALIGAGRCVQGQPLPSNTGVFLASARGDLELTTDTIDQVFRKGATPKPLNFVNTVSNAAAFYVAQCLKLNGRSSFVCNRYFAFESALQLALCSLQLGEIESALIGTVDGIVAPLHQQRRRLQLDANAALAEASHWLWIARTEDSINPADNVVGLIADAGTASTRRKPRKTSTNLCRTCFADTVLGDTVVRRVNSPATQMSVHQCHDWDQLLARLALLSPPSLSLPSTLYFSAGQTLNAGDDEKLLHFLQDRFSASTVQQVECDHPGYFATQSAATINQFLKLKERATLIHINRDRLGRYCILVSALEI